MKRKFGANSRGFSMIDLLAVLAMLFVVCACTMRAAHNMSEADKRLLCANNLKQIGQAINLYAKDDKGPFPRAKYVSEKVDKPTSYTMVEESNPFVGDRIVPNDVSACMYLLIRTKYITADKFVCPSTSQQAMVFPDGKTAQDFSNFKDNSVLSYSYSNPYPTMKALGTGFRMTLGLYPGFAIAGDMNPGGDDLIKLKATMSPDELRKGNSKNHGQDGQNVLYGDGHIEFQTTPFAGMQQDNIYTYGDSGKAVRDETGGIGLIGSPVSSWDSVLLPTADDGIPTPP